MQQRSLGKTNLRASALGMGCSKLGAFWQGRSLSEGERALHEAYDCGVSYFDTADCYARGFSERLIGRAFRRGAPGAVVASKVGLLKTPAAMVQAQRAQGGTNLVTVARGMAPGHPAVASCFHPAYVEQAALRSLRRLRRSHLDVLLLHSPSVDVLRHGAFMPGVERLLERGHVAAFGVSVTDADTLAAAVALPRIDCIQLPDDLFAGAGENVRRTIDERQLGVVTREVLGDGQLIQRACEQGLDPEAAVAERLHQAVTRAGVHCALVGMARPKHVAANIAALSAALRP